MSFSKGKTALVYVVFGSFALAQGETPIAQSLEPLTVTTTTKTERLADKTPAPVTVVTQVEIEAMGAVTLRQALEQTPGLYVSPSGTQMTIRGVGHGDTVYLVDGKRIKGEFSNTYELERIPASMIERIEIVKGPASVLYGADALGGVINIITKQPKAGVSGSMFAQTGANGEGDGAQTALGLDLQGGSETTRFSLFMSRMTRKPYSEKETAQILAGMVKPSEFTHANPPFQANVRGISDTYDFDADYRDDAAITTVGGTLTQSFGDRFKATLDFSKTDEERTSDYISATYASGFLNPQGKPIQIKNMPTTQEDKNTRTDSGLTLDIKATDTLDLRYRISQSKYEKDRAVYAIHWDDLGYDSREDSVSSINVTEMSHRVNELMAAYQPAEAHRVIVGAEHRANEVDSTAYEAEDRDYSSLYTQHEWAATDKLSAVYGARYDDDSLDNDQVSLQAGAVYALSDNHRVKFNFAQGFKAPDDRTLYVNQTNPAGVMMLGADVIAGDKNETHELTPETSRTIELSIAGGASGWRYEATVFRTDFEDRIEQTSENGYNTFRNIGRSRIDGAELSGGYRLGETLLSRAAFTALEAKNRDTDEKLTGTPDRLISLGFDYTPSAYWLLQLNMRHTGEQTTTTETIDGYTLTGFKASFSSAALASTEVYGGIDNLLDEEVSAAIGSDPGRYVYLGARYNF